MAQKVIHLDYQNIKAKFKFPHFNVATQSQHPVTGTQKA